MSLMGTVQNGLNLLLALKHSSLDLLLPQHTQTSCADSPRAESVELICLRPPQLARQLPLWRTHSDMIWRTCRFLSLGT